MKKTDEKLKIGVIGIGHMGSNHVRVLENEKHFFDLVGIYDTNEERAKMIAEEFETVAYNTLDDLLDNVEAVVIAVPSSLHKEVAIHVAERGKHALVEKPIAPTSSEAKEI